jgi:O-antigen ligase
MRAAAMSDPAGAAPAPVVPAPAAVDERASPLARLPALVDDLQLAALIALRPLAWDGDPGNLVNLVWCLLTLVAAAGWICRAWLRPRPCVIAPGGIAVAVVLALLIPALLHAPLPVAGWTLWSMLLIHLVFALYVVQVIRGRTRLALAALGAAVAVEILLALGQWRWALPAMAAQQATTGNLMPGQGISGDDILERLANGGVFATFTLSNHLAAFFALSLPPLIAAAALGWRQRRRIAAGAVAALTLVALVAARHTHAKGVALAVIIAGLVWWIAWLCAPGRRGRAPGFIATAVVLAGALAAVLLVPAAEQALHDSARVRLGYWDGAVRLVAGHPWVGTGLGGFEAYAPAAMPIWAEPAHHAHNEILETAAECGIPAAIAAISTLALLLWRAARPWSAVAAAVAVAERGRAAAAVAVVVAVAIAGGLGAFGGSGISTDTAFTSWPGLPGMAWIAVLAVVGGAAAWILHALPAPPRAALAFALATLFLGAMFDFSLHVGGLVGTAVVIAALAWAATPAKNPEKTAKIPLIFATALVAAALAIDYLVLLPAVNDLNDAHDLIDTCHRAEAGDAQAREDLARVGDGLGVSSNDGRVLVTAIGEHAETLAGADLPTRLSALALSPPGAGRAGRSRALAAQFPFSAGAWSLVSADEFAQAQSARSSGDHASAATHLDAAIDAERKAAGLLPWSLDTRLGLADLYEAAARDLPERAQALRDAAKAERDFVKNNQDIVDARNQPHQH